MLSNCAVEQLSNLLATIEANGQHRFEPSHLNARLHNEDIDLVIATTCTNREEGQFQLFHAIQVQKRIGVLVIRRIRCGRASRAGSDVVLHGHTGVNQGQSSGIEARGEQGAVLGQHMEHDDDGRVWEE